MSRAPAPSIGKHLAVLNLFRERDGSVQITVASATGAKAEYDRLSELPETRLVDYVERLIVEAARNIVMRRPDLIQAPVVVFGNSLRQLLFGEGNVCDDPNCEFCHPAKEAKGKVH